MDSRSFLLCVCLAEEWALVGVCHLGGEQHIFSPRNRNLTKLLSGHKCCVQKKEN